MGKYENFKVVKKMYLTCEMCGKQNEKVTNNNKFDLILCDRCVVLKKVEEIDNKENEQENKSTSMVKRNHEGKIMCNVCNQYFDSIGCHVRTHGMTIAQYRAKYKLSRKICLVSDKLLKKYNGNKKSMSNLKGQKKEKIINDQCQGQMYIDDYNL